MVAMGSLSRLQKFRADFCPSGITYPPYKRERGATASIVWDTANVPHDGAVGAPASGWDGAPEWLIPPCGQ